MLRVLFCVALILSTPLTHAQSSEAAAQYRVARRLVAEGSPAAAEALDRVVALDPSGPLADDALLDRALLVGLPVWPADLGTVTAKQVARARPILKRIVDELPASDRAPEARHRLALLDLAPLPGRDAARARLSLLSLAATNGAASSAARYALAWMAEQAGDLSAAEGAYQRLRIEAAGLEVSARATAGLGRIRLRETKPAEAAASFQHALDSGALPDPVRGVVAEMRAAAVAAHLRRVLTVEALRFDTGGRPSAIAAIPGGGALVAQRKGGTVVEYDATGAAVERWNVDQPLSVAVTANGMRFALTSAALLRLEDGGASAVAAAPGELGSFSAAAAAADGRVWVLDRKGERIGAIAPGDGQPRTLWSGDGVRLSGLAWDGNRLLSLDGRARTVVAIYPDGSSRTLVPEGLERPTAVAVDAAGRIAVLERRGATTRFFDPGGGSLGGFDSLNAGLERASDLGFGLDGALQLIEEGSGVWWRSR